MILSRLVHGSPQLHARGSVHVHDTDRRPPCCGDRDNHTILLPKMLFPAVHARIEEINSPARTRIDSRKIRPLVQIAVMARERQILFGSHATVLARDDVLDMKPEEGVIVLSDMAILTAVARPLAN